MSQSVLEEKEHVAMSTLERGETLLFFPSSIPDIWYLVLNSNISPPHTNNNTFVIEMTRISMSIQLLQDFCSLGPLMGNTLRWVIIKPLIVAQISILSVGKWIKTRIFCKIITVGYYSADYPQTSCCHTTLSLVKRTNSAAPGASGSQSQTTKPLALHSCTQLLVMHEK